MRNRKRARGKGLEQHGKIKCAAPWIGAAACLHIYFSRSSHIARHNAQAARRLDEILPLAPPISERWYD